MAQKIIKVGNSAAVTIPKDDLEALGVSIGSSVRVSSEPENGRIVVELPFIMNDKDGFVDVEVYRTAKGLLKRYKSAFIELANR